VLHRPHRIDITSDDPMFDHFVQRWTFELRHDIARPGGKSLRHRFAGRLRERLPDVRGTISSSATYCRWPETPCQSP
jgi:hypothetical protein